MLFLIKPIPDLNPPPIEFSGSHRICIDLGDDQNRPKKDGNFAIWRNSHMPVYPIIGRCPNSNGLHATRYAAYPKDRNRLAQGVCCGPDHKQKSYLQLEIELLS